MNKDQAGIKKLRLLISAEQKSRMKDFPGLSWKGTGMREKQGSKQILYEGQKLTALVF